MLTHKQAIKEYNSRRPFKAKHLLCNAPFSSINFSQNGDMTACCYNRKDVLGTYPTHSIQDAWEGATANELRTYMKGEQLGGGCENCMEQILSGNYLGSRAIYYDKYATLSGLFTSKVRPPKVFEFEISNTCNLECIMCNGFFSSAIRANREKLPKLHSPYDDAFIENVKEYLPTLTDAKFLGGEPFMISQYYEIWDAIIAVNPSVKVHITTNGTILNKRAKEALEKMNAGIIVSVDSLDKKNYEAIRINGNFDLLMENIRWFIDYRDRKGLYVSFAICPMITNRKYLADIIKFCNENNIYVHFNTVWFPKEECLRNSSSNALAELIEEISEIKYKAGSIQKVNRERVTDFLDHLKTWQIELESEIAPTVLLLEVLKQRNDNDRLLEKNASEFLSLIVSFYDNCIKQEWLCTIPEESLETKLEILNTKIGYTDFIKAFTQCLQYAAERYYAEIYIKDIKPKVEDLTTIMYEIDAKILSNAILKNFNFISLLTSLKDNSYEKIKTDLDYLKQG